MQCRGPFLVVLFSILSIGLIAQESKEKKPSKTTEIELLHADRFTVDKTTPEGASKLVGNVRLKHEDALMFCDSAYLYENNSLDAFGHVRIIDGDSLDMRGDSLFYNGDKKLAKVRGRVIIDNKSSVLKTPFLDYYRDREMAHYYGGGKIVSEKEKITLTSAIGYYYSASKLFHFKKDVVMTHPDYVIKTDTMHYAPEIEKTWFFGPTDIDSEKRHIYCERGWYDQLADKAQFIKNAQVRTSGQTLMGDTINRDEAAQVGIARCNVVLIDTNEKFQVKGDYGIYHEKDSTSLVTKNMMLMQDMSGDTFFLTADTLYSELDTAGNRLIRTYHNNRFYKSDMQGACDSLLYHTKDSIIYLFKDPILWSDENQMTADSIHMTMKDGVIDKMFMNQKAFIIAREDSTYFNQIKGRRMIGYFKDDELYKVDVFGNGETIYYPREEDSTLIGVNETKCSNMTIRIDSNTIKKISFYDKPTALLTPTDEMPVGGKKLDAFNWRIKEKPTSKSDLITMRWMTEIDNQPTDSLDSNIQSSDTLNKINRGNFKNKEPNRPSGSNRGLPADSAPKENQDESGIREED